MVDMKLCQDAALGWVNKVNLLHKLDMHEYCIDVEIIALCRPKMTYP